MGIIGGVSLVLTLGCSPKPVQDHETAAIDDSDVIQKLVIFNDGTWNDDTSDTNVFRLYKAVEQHAVKDQSVRVYYDKGVGSRSLFDKLVGGISSWGIEKNIRQAACDLAMNYDPGDKIYLFGFSRGAFQVRSLNGLIEKIGLIKGKELSAKNYAKKEKRCRAIMDDIYDKVFSHEEIQYQRLAKIREKYPDLELDNTVKAEVIGVWDTVSATGKVTFNNPKYHASEGYAKKVLHAMALDEHRKPYQVVRFTPGVHVKEVWFPGGHADIGGGYGTDFERGALKWMISELKNEGIFNPNLNIVTNACGEMHDEYHENSTLWEKFGEEKRKVKSNDLIHQYVVDRVICKELENPKYNEEKTGKYIPLSFLEDFDGANFDGSVLKQHFTIIP